MSNELKALKEAYSRFEGRLAFEDFETKVNSLAIDKWDFVRGILLYKQALKCRECDPNVAMLLLCSCADAIKVAGKNAGSHKNFKDFYLKYCPSTLRIPPIEYYPNSKPPSVVAPFDKALDFIYSKFRCLYVHEGKGRLENLPEGITWVGSSLLDVYKKELYTINTLKILDWFEKITLESLYNVL